MARTSLPPGFRFHPTDVELVMYYLKRKLIGKKLSFEAISELNIYTFGPWDLPAKSCLRSKDLEWYFFCPRERKYANGARANRATENGYWKTTGKDRHVSHKEKTVGMVKTLVFHLGHAPRGERTDWVMHEYRSVDKDLTDAQVQDAYVLCKVFQKSGPGPKNGAQYGAPFNEEEWEDDADICFESSEVDGLSLTTIGLTNKQNIRVETSIVDGLSLTTFGLTNKWNSTAATSILVPHSTCSGCLTEPVPTGGPSANVVLPDVSSGDDILSLLAMFREETLLAVGNDNNKELIVLNRDEVIEDVSLDGNDVYNGLGDLGNCADLNEGGSKIFSILEAGYALSPMLGGDDISFLELNDLGTPLEFTAKATESEQSQSNTFSGHYNGGSNLDNIFYGCNTDQNFSSLNQSPMLLDGSCWEGNHINLLQQPCMEFLKNQENVSLGSTSQGYNSTSYCMDLGPTRQPEGSGNAGQPQLRGERQRKPYLFQQSLESIPARTASAAQ